MERIPGWPVSNYSYLYYDSDLQRVKPTSLSISLPSFSGWPGSYLANVVFGSFCTVLYKSLQRMECVCVRGEGGGRERRLNQCSTEDGVCVRKRGGREEREKVESVLWFHFCLGASKIAPAIF